MPRGTPVAPEKDEIDTLFGGPEEEVETPTATNGHQVVTPAQKTDDPEADARYAAIAKQLAQPLDPALVKTRLANPQQPEGPKNPRLKYIEWNNVVRNLNRIFGFGKWHTDIKEVRYLSKSDGEVFGVQVTMQLTVEFDTKGYRTAYFTNTGYSPISSVYQIEMATGGATHTALKRCATALGEQFGLDLYDKDESEVAAAPAAHSAPAAAKPATQPSTLTGDSFDCQDCGKEVKGYYSTKQQRDYTTQDLYEMSMKQTGGLYCFKCKPNHTKR